MTSQLPPPLTPVETDSLEVALLTRMLADQLQTAEMMLRIRNYEMLSAELQSAGDTLACLRAASGSSVYSDTTSVPQRVITVGGPYPERP